jgi:rubredoxin
MSGGLKHKIRKVFVVAKDGEVTRVTTKESKEISGGLNPVEINLTTESDLEWPCDICSKAITAFNQIVLDKRLCPVCGLKRARQIILGECLSPGSYDKTLVDRAIAVRNLLRRR